MTTSIPQQPPTDSSTETTPLLVGIDWADSKHDLTIIQGARVIKHIRFNATPLDVEQIISELRHLAAGRKIAVCLEKGRVRIIHHLMLHQDVILYPIDPKQVARYRESFKSSRAKDDGGDSFYLARLLQERLSELNPMKPDDPLTRRIALLCETRRSLVNDKTSVIQQLCAKIKMYHPLALMLPVKQLDSTMVRDFIHRFPDPRTLRKTRKETLVSFFANHGFKNPERVAKLIELIRQTPLATDDPALIEPLVIHVQTLIKQLDVFDLAIKQCEQDIAASMNQHPDANLFRCLPGAGAALAPRLLTLFGSDRQRYADADALASYVGIAPVTIQSGKHRQVSRRLELNARKSQKCPSARD
jgi:transposase